MRTAFFHSERPVGKELLPFVGKLILQDLKHIAPALESAFGNYLNVTPADALLVLLEERSFDQIRKMPLSAMTDLIQRKWKELYSICHPDIYLGEEEKRGKAS